MNNDIFTYLNKITESSNPEHERIIEFFKPINDEFSKLLLMSIVTKDFLIVNTAVESITVGNVLSQTNNIDEALKLLKKQYKKNKETIVSMESMMIKNEDFKTD